MSKFEQVKTTSYDTISSKPENKKNNNETLRIVNKAKFGRACLLALTVAAGIGIGADHLVEKSTGSTIPEHFNDTAAAAVELIKNEETYSDETNTYRAEYGDTTWGLTKENLAGVDKIDIRKAVDYIQNMPENADTFSDGVLQEGESIAIPVSVEKP